MLEGGWAGAGAGAGGGCSHFLSVASGTDGMKTEAYKEVITRTLGSAPKHGDVVMVLPEAYANSSSVSS